MVLGLTLHLGLSRRPYRLRPERCLQPQAISQDLPMGHKQRQCLCPRANPRVSAARGALRPLDDVLTVQEVKAEDPRHAALASVGEGCRDSQFCALRWAASSNDDRVRGDVGVTDCNGGTQPLNLNQVPWTHKCVRTEGSQASTCGSVNHGHTEMGLSLDPILDRNEKTRV